jgi:hypothetical protein
MWSASSQRRVVIEEFVQELGRVSEEIGPEPRRRSVSKHRLEDAHFRAVSDQ